MCIIYVAPGVCGSKKSLKSKIYLLLYNTTNTLYIMNINYFIDCLHVIIIFNDTRACDT